MCQSCAEVVKVVRAVEAIQRKPKVYKPSFTFYGHMDFWDYVAKWDDVLCDRCKSHERGDPYVGSYIRDEFPDHVIVGPDKILANVHQNCRCELRRIKPVTKRRFRDVVPNPFV